MNCPHCFSPLDPNNRYLCSQCNGDLNANVDQKEADNILLNMAFQSERIIRKHTMVVLFVSLFATVVPVGPLVGAGVLLVLGFSIRRHFRGPAKQYIKNTQRRMFAGWLPRLAVLTIGSWVFIFLSLPCFISFSWPITYALIIYSSNLFYSSLVTQEKNGEPVPTWQSCGLVLMAVCLILTLAGVILMATIAGVAVSCVTDLTTCMADLGIIL
jgi:hypothetical protein